MRVPTICTKKIDRMNYSAFGDVIFSREISRDRVNIDEKKIISGLIFT